MSYNWSKYLGKIRGNRHGIFFSWNFSQKLHLGIFFSPSSNHLWKRDKMLSVQKTGMIWNAVEMPPRWNSSWWIYMGPGFSSWALAESFFKRPSHHPFLVDLSGSLHQSQTCGWQNLSGTISGKRKAEHLPSSAQGAMQIQRGSIRWGIKNLPQRLVCKGAINVSQAKIM